MKKFLSITMILALSAMAFACNKNSRDTCGARKGGCMTLRIIFAGDLMQHRGQIDAARNADGTYSYDETFRYVKEKICSADIAIANFETTLGGKPYRGYPCFSAPDEFLKAVVDAGFNVLVTANNQRIGTDNRHDGQNGRAAPRHI